MHWLQMIGPTTPGRALEESIWLPSYRAEAYDSKMPRGVRFSG